LPTALSYWPLPEKRAKRIFHAFQSDGAREVAHRRLLPKGRQDFPRHLAFGGHALTEQLYHFGAALLHPATRHLAYRRKQGGLDGLTHWLTKEQGDGSRPRTDDAVACEGLYDLAQCPVGFSGGRSQSGIACRGHGLPSMDLTEHGHGQHLSTHLSLVFGLLNVAVHRPKLLLPCLRRTCATHWVRLFGTAGCRLQGRGIIKGGPCTTHLHARRWPCGLLFWVRKGDIPLCRGLLRPWGLHRLRCRCMEWRQRLQRGWRLWLRVDTFE